jgi:DNA-binding NarL/FixJ family response regulator
MIRVASRILGPHFDLLEAVADGKSAVDAVLLHRPDVAVLDILMPVLDGIQATRKLVKQGARARIVVLSGLEEEQYVNAALEAGARAFVFKRRVNHDLAFAINEVLQGRTFISPERDS